MDREGPCLLRIEIRSYEVLGDQQQFEISSAAFFSRQVPFILKIPCSLSIL